MTHLIKRIFFVVVMALSVAAAPALASPLSDAKSAGHLGEQANGYVGVVAPTAPAAAKSLAKSINLQRKEKYRSIAKRNKTSLSAVEAVVGKKLIDRAARGEFILGQGGRWHRK